MKINDIDIREPIPSIAESSDGILIILGGGKTVWDDYKRAKKLIGDRGYEIMCVNDIAIQFKAEPIQHCVSLHKGFAVAVRALRKERSMLEHVHTHCHKHGSQIDFVWDIPNVGGTSGLFAVKVAMVLGYKKIIVCGAPMDGTGHYFDPNDANENLTTKFHDKSNIMVWRQLREQGRHRVAEKRVRSMSGRTRNVLGEPTEEWLNEINK